MCTALRLTRRHPLANQSDVGQMVVVPVLPYTTTTPTSSGFLQTTTTTILVLVVMVVGLVSLIAQQAGWTSRCHLEMGVLRNGLR